MSRIAPPDQSTNFFEHDLDLNKKFNQLYAELWQRGTVDEVTKEIGRLRNAQITDCGI